MKKVVKILLIIIAVFGVIFLGVVGKEYSELKDFDQTPVDLSEVADGVYEGSSETTLVKASVRVTVKNGSIENIEILRHECGKGLPANNIVDDMVSQNEIDVDAVSGATVSSEVIKDAVRNALR